MGTAMMITTITMTMMVTTVMTGTETTAMMTNMAMIAMKAMMVKMGTETMAMMALMAMIAMKPMMVRMVVPTNSTQFTSKFTTFIAQPMEPLLLSTMLSLQKPPSSGL